MSYPASFLRSLVFSVFSCIRHRDVDLKWTLHIRAAVLSFSKLFCEKGKPYREQRDDNSSGRSESSMPNRRGDQKPWQRGRGRGDSRRDNHRPNNSRRTSSNNSQRRRRPSPTSSSSSSCSSASRGNSERSKGYREYRRQKREKKNDEKHKRRHNINMRHIHGTHVFVQRTTVDNMLSKRSRGQWDCLCPRYKYTLQHKLRSMPQHLSCVCALNKFETNSAFA